MLACYFRSLFKNTKDGIVQSGCVQDGAYGTRIDFVYTAGSYANRIDTGQDPGKSNARYENIDLYVLGAYSISHICKLMELLSERVIKTVVLPYLTPIQRLFLAEKIPKDMKGRREVVQFLEAPYLYLKTNSVKNVFFLYDNGKPISRDMDFLAPGYQFEPAEQDIKKLVTEMEGCEIPIVKAGYIVLGQWIFYFGAYGPDVKKISQFVREEIRDSIAELRQTMEDFRKRFGENPFGTIVMYEGPLRSGPAQKDSLLTAKVISKECECISRVQCDGINCAMKCQHQYDYDVMQYHKNKERDQDRFGVFLSGNVDLRTYLPEVVMRFWNIKEKLRVVTLPNCGAEKYWNSQILQLSGGRDIRYWLCPIRNDTSTRALLQIITENSFNRLIQLNNEYGFCLSGYLIPVEERENL